MPVLLQVGLTLIFFIFAFILFMFPTKVKEYVDLRFQGLHQFAIAHSAISSIISQHAVKNIPLSTFKAVFLFPIMCGVAILLQKRAIILGFAYIVMGIGGILHMPYTTVYLKPRTASQIKRLMLVFAVFCGLIVLANKGAGNSEITKVS